MSGRRPVPGRRQDGAALVIGLLLLLVLTVLGVSSMSASTMELSMAGNLQYQQRAFEAAESILESELQRPDIVPLAAPGNLPDIATNIARPFQDASGKEIAIATGRTSYEISTPAAGWSLGTGASFSAHHFEVAAQASAARGAIASHRQGYFVIGPSP